jgi:glucuronoarabinoxylan endo-1,4-beta-xylanase
MAASNSIVAGFLLAVLCAATTGCSPNEDPQTGSQTNWLRACNADADCGSQSCNCGICTHPCDADAACSELPGASCVGAQDPGAVALCGGSSPSASALCLARCGDDVCADGQVCVAGVCSPLSSPNARVTVDSATHFQVLAGFGATLAYAENDVVQHPRQLALLEAMFSNLGLDMLRLRNRYAYTGDDNLASAKTIVDAAAVSLVRKPTIILTSWSPPASLKANDATLCRGNDDSCTLTRLSGGGFDYDGYAAYWRASLDAYTLAGVVPDYVGIQNNPDFVPTSAEPGEGCKFLPTQGTAIVTTNGVGTTFEFPGYAQALQAVVNRFQDLAAPPKIIAPDVSIPGTVAQFLSFLDVASIDAIGHHLYGSDPTTPNEAVLRQLNQLGQSTGRPVFQTEMQADGMGTAALMHQTLVTEGAAAYLHNALVGPGSTATVDSGALIAIDSQDFVLQPAYHALRHYALHTDPGWVRVQADSNQSNLLASAWLSPAGDSLAIVIINSGLTPLDVELGYDETMANESQVTRTVFDGLERSADLGRLPKERMLRLPGRSMATIALKR